MSESAKIKSKFRVLGIMSGTSLDGLDLALVEFHKKESGWSFNFKEAHTIAYDEIWKQKLQSAITLESAELVSLDLSLGAFFGENIKKHFGSCAGIDFIASHGHTIFHQTHKKLTLQIGNGQKIFEATGVPVINDFRSKDVQLGGQGAPLVPIGDRDLFSDFEVCLNLGGIANCSFTKNEKRLAFDIMPFNMVLNFLANELGMDYDDGGKIAQKGHVDEALLRKLKKISFYKKTYPKSLGFEDFEQIWKAILLESSASIEDKLHTYTLHTSQVIGKVINELEMKPCNILITGGGAFNHFFIEKLKAECKGKVEVPNTETIAFKEAIVFAYLGLLNFLDVNNCISSVTGALHDNVGGRRFGF